MSEYSGKMIIKHGKQMSPLTTKRFECSRCGCIFTCEAEEYSVEIDGPRRTVYSTCPEPECKDISFEVSMR